MFYPSHTNVDARALINGFSLIEIVIAIGLIAVFASSLFVYLGTQLLSTTESRRALEAMERSREGMEASRLIRDASWSGLTTGTHGLFFSTGTWSFQNASDTADGFTRSVHVIDLSENERQIVSSVSWHPSPERTRSISLTTALSNWRNAVMPQLSGDWTNPQALGTIDLGPGIQGTGIAVRNRFVYMTGRASAAAKPDFFVINALDGQHPSISASINTGPGANAIAISGNFAYVASDEASNHLQTINISATGSPAFISNFHLAGNNENALSVAVTGTLVLVGTEQDAGQELYLIDVTNPTVPLIKSSLEIGDDVNRIVIFENLAYLGTSSSTGEFIVVNFANPNAPAVLATVNLPGSAPAKGLFVNPQDHRAYVTRKHADGTSPEMNIYDVSSPDTPSLLGSMEFGNDVPAVFAADALLFIGTDISNLDFQIFNSTNPGGLAYINGLNFPQYVNDIAFENNTMYVTLRSNDALRIITSQ